MNRPLLLDSRVERFQALQRCRSDSHPLMLESRVRCVNAIQRLWWVDSAIYMSIGERMGGRERENARTQTQNTQKDKQTNNKQAQFYDTDFLYTSLGADYGNPTYVQATHPPTSRLSLLVVEVVRAECVALSPLNSQPETGRVHCDQCLFFPRDCCVDYSCCMVVSH